MKAYKGFNRDMTCRGFQFEEGKEYHEEEAVLCESGFHACENPLDTFSYYAPGNSVFHEVDLDEVSDERNDDDTKICAKTIRVGARLDVAGLCKAHFEYVSARCEPANGRVAGDKESAAAGNWGSAAAGYKGSAAAGDKGSAAAGNCGSAAAGEQGSAAAGYKDNDVFHGLLHHHRVGPFGDDAQVADGLAAAGKQPLYAFQMRFHLFKRSERLRQPFDYALIFAFAFSGYSQFVHQKRTEQHGENAVGNRYFHRFFPQIYISSE